MIPRLEWNKISKSDARMSELPYHSEVEFLRNRNEWGIGGLFFFIPFSEFSLNHDYKLPVPPTGCARIKPARYVERCLVWRHYFTVLVCRSFLDKRCWVSTVYVLTQPMYRPGFQPASCKTSLGGLRVIG